MFAARDIATKLQLTVLHRSLDFSPGIIISFTLSIYVIHSLALKGKMLMSKGIRV